MLTDFLDFMDKKYEHAEPVNFGCSEMSTTEIKWEVIFRLFRNCKITGQNVSTIVPYGACAESCK
jgi:hypothetical protein